MFIFPVICAFVGIILARIFRYTIVFPASLFVFVSVMISEGSWVGGWLVAALEGMFLVACLQIGYLGGAIVSAHLSKRDASSPKTSTQRTSIRAHSVPYSVPRDNKIGKAARRIPAAYAPVPKPADKIKPAA
jgi:hypothetical protein